MADPRTTAVEVVLVNGMHFEATDADRISVSIDSSAEFQGEGLGMRPMELMLVALGGCTGMDVISILRKKRQDVTAYRVEVVGTIADSHPHVYTEIAIRHVVTGRTIADEAVKRAIQLSEDTYCSAYRMLSKAATMSTTFEIVAAVPTD